MTGTSARKVLLIGWDAADWKVIHPLLDAGRMPNLERIVNRGVIGNLATIHPDLSPMLWTSIATGKRPFKHGIAGFTEPDPDTGGIRPVTGLSRRTKAIWNILGQTGRRCVVVGWWPSHPAEPIRGVMVSNHYQRSTGPAGKPRPLPPGTVHPARLVRNLAELRWHPDRLEAGHILPFVPRAAEIDQEKDKRLATLAKIICECLSVHEAARAVLHHEPWDFAAVYFDGIDHFSHAFMRYHPPRLEWVPERDFEIYKDVVQGGYILHDMLLGNLLAEAGEDATVILASDHGFHCDHLRPRHIPGEPAGPAVQHRHYGVLAIRGPAVKRDERIYGACLLDLCPTILALLGLPVGEDMDGKVLTDAFVEVPPLETVPSWDELPGEAGLHPPHARVDPAEAREAVERLVALGYIARPDENRQKAVAETVRELDYNMARAYMDAGRHLDAVPLLERLTEGWPEEYRFGIQLAACCTALGRVPEARRVTEETLRRKRVNARAAREKLEAWRKEHGARKPEDLTEPEQRELRNLRMEAAANPFALEYLLGSLLAAEGDQEGALEHLERAEKADPRQPGLYVKLGDVHLMMERWEDAERCFAKALSLDEDSSVARLGLCRCLLARRRNAEAAEAAMDAVNLVFFNPRGHFLLATALHRLGEVDRAVSALKLAVSQNPNFPEAHRRLAYLYRKRLHNPLKAAEHGLLARQAAQRIRKLRQAEGVAGPGAGAPEATPRQGPEGALPSCASETPRGADPLGGYRNRALQNQPDGAEPFGTREPAGPDGTITVVSGLPRSGTSMMMQMLRAGGLPLLEDGGRAEDENNPRGYLEFEGARRLREDASWLPEARGRAVKIVAQLLPFLRGGFGYRVIFMERDMDEVLASQQAMLSRQGERAQKVPEAHLGRVFAGQVERVRGWLRDRGIPTLSVRYAEAVARPAEAAGRVNAFLGGGLDEAAMALAVDGALYRRRGSLERS